MNGQSLSVCWPQGGFLLDKFALYYPDNTAAAERAQGGAWDLLEGYSFRTAALTGTLNRGALDALGRGYLPAEGGTRFAAADWGLVVSTLEDCAYVQTVSLLNFGRERSSAQRSTSVKTPQTGKYGPVFG